MMNSSPAKGPVGVRHVILITGAATGIGALAATSLAAAGHLVYASMREPDGRNAEKARALVQSAKQLPGEVRIVSLDVLSEESVTRAVTIAPFPRARSRVWPSYWLPDLGSFQRLREKGRCGMTFLASSRHAESPPAVTRSPDS